MTSDVRKGGSGTHAGSATHTDTGTRHGAPSPPTPGRALRRGERVGRYLVLEEVGAGGMGVVWKAFDPELERLVAVKLLHDAGEPLPEQARARLVQEGRALARVAHPHVVAVHDVGTFGGELFVAMEYVEGHALDAWLAAEPRPRAAILDVFRAAATGLAAAHDAGVVHRDFKPGNVLVGSDGRVRVADFGLARAAVPGDAPAASGDAGSALAGVPAEAAPSATLRLAGSPPYMAPEQHAGLPADPRADQFAFCAALYEALTGQRAFPGPTLDALAQQKREGALRPPPDARVPRWLLDILRRGLRPDPAARHPSMAAVVAALDRGRARQRRWVLGGAGALAGLAVVAVLALSARAAPGVRCATPPAALAGAWDDGVRARIARAFTGARVPSADDTLARVAARLDGYAAAWAHSRTDACEDTHVRGEQSAHLLDLRIACLERRREALGALTAALAGAGSAAEVNEATRAVASLAPVAACDDREALLAATPPPADAQTAAEVARLRARLDAVAARTALGRAREAVSEAEALVADAARTAYPPVHVEALSQRVAVLTRAEPRRSEAAARQLLTVAARAGDDARVASALRALVNAIGVESERTAEAMTLAVAAEAAIDRVGARAGGDGSGVQGGAGSTGHGSARATSAEDMRGELGLILGVAHARRAEYDAARTHLEAAERAFIRAHGEVHLGVAKARANLSLVVRSQGDLARGRELVASSLAIKEQLFGPAHPEVALTLVALAGALFDEDRFDEAARAAERALAIMRPVDARSSTVENATVLLALVANVRGEPALALERLREALALLESTYGPEHPAVARVLPNLAAALSGLGRDAEAEAAARRALAIREKHGSAGQPEVNFPLHQLAIALADQGKRGEAERHLARALELLERAFGPDDVRRADLLVTRGRLLLARGALAAAEATGREALALWTGPDGRPRAGKVAPAGVGRARALLFLADVALARGDAAAARARHDEARALYDRHLGAGRLPAGAERERRWHAVRHARVDPRH